MLFIGCFINLKTIFYFVFPSLTKVFNSFFVLPLSLLRNTYGSTSYQRKSSDIQAAMSFQCLTQLDSDKLFRDLIRLHEVMTFRALLICPVATGHFLRSADMVQC